MALGSLPPWLQINPRDFLLATQAGAQLGNTIAEQTTKAFENQQRLKMEEEQNKTKQAQQAIENAMTRLAADRLENYRQQEAAARQQQLGIEQKRLGSLDIQQQRADEQAKHNRAIEEERNNIERDKANKRQIRAGGGRLWDVTDPANPVALTPAPVRPPPKDPLQSALLGADAASLRSTERDIQKRDAEKPSGLGALFHPFYQSETDKMKAAADAMRKEMQSKYGTKKRFTYDPNTSELSPVGESDPESGDY